MNAQEVVMCSGGCGKHWPADDIDKCPWELLTIRARLRCWDCGRALVAAANAGTDAAAEYKELGPNDRGALKEMPKRPPLHEAPGRSSGNLEWE